MPGGAMPGGAIPGGKFIPGGAMPGGAMPGGGGGPPAGITFTLFGPGLGGPPEAVGGPCPSTILFPPRVIAAYHRAVFALQDGRGRLCCAVPLRLASNRIERTSGRRSASSLCVPAASSWSHRSRSSQASRPFGRRPDQEAAMSFDREEVMSLGSTFENHQFREERAAAHLLLRPPPEHTQRRCCQDIIFI